MEPDGYPADCGQPMTEAERMELRCQLSGLGWRWRDPARGNLLPRLVLALGGLRVGQVYRLGIAGGGEPPPSLARLGFTAAPAEHWWHGFVESAGPEPREEEVACGPDQDHVRRSVLSYALGLLPGEVREAMIS
jgi:hypothetical protein